MKAVVFAYHNVGVRCLSVLLARGVEVALVVTHEDAAGETIWFDSVRALCERARLPWITPGRADDPALARRIEDLAPDAIFSFYYRHMLPAHLLAIPPLGGFNMHGSLLPRYRGRVPVNWAIIHGERETGATLHEMTAKPDAGAILGQQAVPILPNDTAHEVFAKVNVAAELVLDRALAGLVDGSLVRQPQDLAAGSYFGGRSAADGRIDWSKGAWSVHNLVRAVAPPYPGAFADVGPRRLRILRTWWETGAGAPARQGADRGAALLAERGLLWLRCADGGRIRLLEAELDGVPLTLENFSAAFGGALDLSDESPRP